MSTVILPNIAFIGGAGAGKTTAAELLVKHFDYDRLSFATPLKVMLATSTDRARLQEFGTDVVRAYEPDAWVNLFVEYELNRGDRHARAVVDDARFVNEVMRLRMEEFKVVRVRAPESLRIARLKASGKLQDEAQLSHSSETELDDYRADYSVENAGDPDVLLEQLVTILNKERR